MQPIITVEKLSKKYKLSHQSNRPRYKSLRDVIMGGVRGVLRSRGKSSRDVNPKSEEFWALKDVNFEIQQGDVVGIIGRNGAGKSTLLKVLSRITEPTTGRIGLRGRVASLLEVGTGFHPELTGRENIYLNGAILGMTRVEIKSKFDEIVEFAGVEKFLDTPVKHYSSGMYVRLAFAVAAHLEPEILVVDEVLAVGDAEFQKKCLGKMRDVSAQDGRTVIFVSHNMNAVEELCNRAIMLEGGTVTIDSCDVRSTLKHYLFGQENDKASTWANDCAKKNEYFQLLSLSISGGDGRPLPMPVRNDSSMWVDIRGQVLQPDPALTIGYAVFSDDGTPLYWSYLTDGPEEDWPHIVEGHIRCRARIPSRFLNEGTYRIEAIAGLHFIQWFYEPGVTAPYVYLQIAGGLSDSPYWMTRRPGMFAPLMDWDVKQLPHQLKDREISFVQSARVS